VPVPDFQTLMRPLLETLASGEERPISEVRADLAKRFSLTEEELAERLPSGLAGEEIGGSETGLAVTGSRWDSTWAGYGARGVEKGAGVRRNAANGDRS
jgi:hypothetical protein